MEFNCSYCDVTFVRSPSQVKGDRAFCSRSCANRAEPRRKLEGVCKLCGEPKRSGRTFCGPVCAKVGTAKRVRNKTKSQSVIDWRQRTKQKLVEYMGSKCVDCGYDKCLRALHFHHLDPTQKDLGIGGSSKSFEALKAEADKCVLLCANCHAERHSEKESNPHQT